MDAFRERPTREACDAGITILLVGNPSGPLDAFFDTSVIEAKHFHREKDQFCLETRLRAAFCWPRVFEREEFRSIGFMIGTSAREGNRCSSSESKTNPSDHSSRLLSVTYRAFSMFLPSFASSSVEEWTRPLPLLLRCSILCVHRHQQILLQVKTLHAYPRMV